MFSDIPPSLKAHARATTWAVLFRLGIAACRRCPRSVPGSHTAPAAFLEKTRISACRIAATVAGLLRRGVKLRQSAGSTGYRGSSITIAMRAAQHAEESSKMIRTESPRGRRSVRRVASDRVSLSGIIGVVKRLHLYLQCRVISGASSGNIRAPAESSVRFSTQECPHIRRFRRRHRVTSTSEMVFCAVTFLGKN